MLLNYQPCFLGSSLTALGHYETDAVKIGGKAPAFRSADAMLRVTLTWTSAVRHAAHDPCHLLGELVLR
jgi:hypothetical protein